MKRSIKETIRSRLLFMGILSMLLTALLTTTVFYRGFARQVAYDLEMTARAAAGSYILSDDVAMLEQVSAEELRATLVAPDGTVLYDSDADPAQMENHLDRPEIQSALRDGVGRDQRRSASLGSQTFYCALLLPQGTVLRMALETGGSLAFFDEAVPVILLTCLLIFLVSAAVSWLLTRGLMRPIEQLGGDLDNITEAMPYQELLPFAQAIQNDHQLRKTTERMRREFTANVSHELKTPLTSISGYAELLEAGMVRQEDLPAFAGRIRTEAARLQSLVADILQLSELDGLTAEHGTTLPAEFTAVDLLALARRCTDRLALNARQAYVTLLAEGEPLTVQGSPHHLEELAYNLCDNAIRYNRPGGRVVIHVETMEGRPALRVEDNGIGIPKEHQDRIFERFYRVDKSRSKATGGTGLGLAIVKHIALMHDAQLVVKSQAGAGTSITVLFPAAGRKAAGG